MFVKKFLLFFTALAIFHNLHAQLCTGSRGDPVVQVTFGSGGGFGAPLDPTITSYNYMRNSCPNDGYYTISSKTDTCFSSSWFSVPEDHTPGDIGGRMMIINAASIPGDFYVDTIRDLCSETTYEFAAWILNVLKRTSCDNGGIRPNITFRIETTTGTVLSTFNTGDINPTAFTEWQQFGLSFSTPPLAFAVVMRLTNNAPGGCGNDLILDDITFKACGPKVSTTINGSNNNKDVCLGDTTSYAFSGFVDTVEPIVYQWQTSTDSATWVDVAGANTSSYSIPPINVLGNYFFRLTVAKPNNILIPACRTSSIPIKITVYGLPVPSASNNGPVCENSSINLSAINGSQYEWTGPNNFISNLRSPLISNIPFNGNGKYYVKVTSFAGCVNFDSTTVVINPNPVVDAGTNKTICEGTKTQLNGSTNPANTWSWSPSAGLSNSLSLNPVASPGKTTLYTLTVYDKICFNSDSVLVNVLAKPLADAGPDKAFIGNQTITLDGKATGSNIFYYWTPDYFIFSDSILNPKVTPPFDTTYTLHVVSKDGCGVATDQVFVKYYKQIYIPNAFTPNNDGKNDRWGIPLLTDYPLVEIKVYNRFGQLIFYNKGNTKKWDGTFKGIQQPTGVYCYTIDLNNGMKIISGIVTLIR